MSHNARNITSRNPLFKKLPGQCWSLYFMSQMLRVVRTQAGRTRNSLSDALCSPQKLRVTVMNWPPVAEHGTIWCVELCICGGDCGAVIWSRGDKKYRVIFLTACCDPILAKLWEVSWLNAGVGHEFILTEFRHFEMQDFAGQVFCCLATWPKLPSSYLFYT